MAMDMGNMSSNVTDFVDAGIVHGDNGVFFFYNKILIGALAHLNKKEGYMLFYKHQ